MFYKIILLGMRYFRKIATVIIPLTLTACVGQGDFDDEGNRIIEFKDTRFKSALIEQGIDTNGDNEVSVKEMARATSIDCTDKNISDISAIRFARDAKELLFSGNNLTGNFDFVYLNNLSKINFSNNPNLQSVTLHYRFEDSNGQIVDEANTTAEIIYTKRPNTED